MPRSRSRRADPGLVRHTSDLPAVRTDHTEMAADLGVLARRGSRPAKTWTACLREGRRFERWLTTHGLELVRLRELAEHDPYGLPILPPVLIAAYLHDVATPEMKPKTLKNISTDLLGWFRGTGWAVPDRRTRGGVGQLDLVGAVVANHRFDDVDAHVRVPSRALGQEWIAPITAAIDASYDDDRIAPLWVEAMRTFHLVTAWFGFRGGEAVTKLRWGWFDDRGDELVVTVPGDHTLKYLASSRTLRLPSPDRGEHCEHRETCVIHQLRRWQEMCEDAGVPAGADDLVFPAIRRMPGEPSTPHSDNFWQNRPWVADPVAEMVAAAHAAGADADQLARVAATAAATQYKRYALYWKSFAAAAGFEPRHRFEKVSTHSNRRGTATRMRTNGASLPVISYQLCHGGMGTTPRYVEPDELTPPDPRPLYDLSLPPHGDLAPRSLAPRLDPDAPELGTSTTCELVHDGTRCSDPFAGFVELDGVMVAVCTLHRARYLDGRRGPSLAEPAAWRPLGEFCEVGAAETPCDREPLAHINLGGALLTACPGHYQRFHGGITGDALHAPLRHRLDDTCWFADGDAPCERPPRRSFEVDGIRRTSCATHWSRYCAGQRGAALHVPIAVQRRLAERCEVPHAGLTCGRDARVPQGCFIVVDGIDVTACGGHYQRYRAGKRGAALTKPIRNLLASTCELSHDGVACGRKTKGRVFDAGSELAACHSHLARYRKGKRGVALNTPIRSR